MACLWLRQHGCDALFIPVRWPEVAIINAERIAAGPSSDPRELPSSDEGIGNTGGIPHIFLVPSERQFHDPVSIDLVRGVEVGNRSPAIGRKCIRQTRSRRTDIDTRTPAKPGC